MVQQVDRPSNTMSRLSGSAVAVTSVSLERSVSEGTGMSSRRGNCIRHLSVENTMSTVGMPAEVTESVLSSQCSSLETLCVEALTMGLSGAEFQALACLTRLRELEVVARNVLFDDGAVALLWTIEDLPALTDLHVCWDGMVYHLLDRISATNRLPCCGDLAELHSRSLTQLRVRMLGGPTEDNTLRLSGLPELRSCAIVGEADLPLSIRVDDASFQGAPQLQSLHLHFDARFQLQQGALAQLTVLTSLTLMGCGLRSVPADAASLGATLCELDLSYNDRLQIDGAAVESILCCSRLTTLNLHKSDIAEWQNELDDVWERVEEHIAQEGYTPAQFSMASIMHLLQLQPAFRSRHGRDLDVSLQNNITCRCLCRQKDYATGITYDKGCRCMKKCDCC